MGSNPIQSDPVRMGAHFVDVAKVVKNVPASIVFNSEVLAGFFQVLKNKGTFMFNRCIVSQQNVGVSYTGLEAAMNLFVLREKLNAKR